MTVAGTILKVPIHLYRWTLKAFFGWRCRHVPSCSDYALQAIDTNGAWRGFWLTVARLCRCHPWGTHGFDPVPDIRKERHPLAPWRYGRWQGTSHRDQRVPWGTAANAAAAYRTQVLDVEPHMTAPDLTAGEPAPKKSSPARRVAAVLLILLLVFGLLWYTVFTAITAALVSAGVTGVLVVGASASEIGETILDMLAETVLGILAAIAAFFAAIFSIFS